MTGVLGIGNDILEIDRIGKALATHGLIFRKRIFTPKEQEYCLSYTDPIPHFAGRFSAKEAIFKALGTGVGKGGGWLDLEILPSSQGQPIVHCSPELNLRFDSPRFLLSISHSSLYVTAVAIWVNGK